jgi:protein-disulfide isomerase
MDDKNRDLTKKERRELRRQEKQEDKRREQKQEEQKRLRKRVALWLSVVLGLGGVVFGMIWFINNTSSRQTGSISVSPASVSNTTKGNKEAKVTLIEYSDFQCPACRTQYVTVKKLAEEFSDKVQFIYHHFPLKQIHANAELAAWAAEAAGRQGKFWEMHDLLFENQTTWANLHKAEDNFIRYAQSLNLNVEQFKQDLYSKEVKEKVENDYQSSVQLGIGGTPTFVLNGKRLEQNPRNYEEFKTILQEAIKNNS